MRHLASRLALLGIAALVTLTPPASAAEPDRAGARSAGEEGMQAFHEGRYDDAIRFLEKAESLYHAPSHLLFLARSHAAQGRLVRAQEAYSAVVNETLPANASKTFQNAQVQARAELQELKPRIPKLTLTVHQEYPELSITLDGSPLSLAHLGVPLPTDPGEHVVVATAKGKARTEKRITLAESARESLALELEDAPAGEASGASPVVASEGQELAVDASQAPSALPADGSSRATWSYVLLGGGAVFVGVGSYFGLAAKSQRDDALGDDALCGGNSCTASGRDEIDAATLKAHIATGGLALGAAALGVGAYLLLTGQPATSEVAWTPVVSPDGVGITYGGTL